MTLPYLKIEEEECSSKYLFTNYFRKLFIKIFISINIFILKNDKYNDLISNLRSINKNCIQKTI